MFPPAFPSPTHLHEDPLRGEGGGVGIDEPLWGIVDSLVGERGDGGHPRPLVLERLLPLGPPDQLVGEGSPLHHVVVLVRLPGHGEFDVTLELTPSATELALHLTTPMARPAPDQDKDNIMIISSLKLMPVELKFDHLCNRNNFYTKIMYAPTPSCLLLHVIEKKKFFLAVSYSLTLSKIPPRLENFFQHNNKN